MFQGHTDAHGSPLSPAYDASAKTSDFSLQGQPTQIDVTFIGFPRTVRNAMELHGVPCKAVATRGLHWDVTTGPPEWASAPELPRVRTSMQLHARNIWPSRSGGMV